MRRTRRWFPLVIAALFMIVTVGHEANFIGSFEPLGWAWLGLPFSLGVDLATFVSLYFTRWAATRTWAWRSYIVFVSASGVFNLAYLFGVAAESGRFGRGPVADVILGVGVATVALFPPVAISVMGFVEREAEGLRKPKKKSESEELLLQQIADLEAEAAAQRAQLEEEARILAAQVAEAAQVAAQFSDDGGNAPYKVCTLCGFAAQSPQAWAGHCKGAPHRRRYAEFCATRDRSGPQEAESCAETREETL